MIAKELDKSTDSGFLIQCIERMGIQMRPYQLEALGNHQSGIEIWLWGRQCGKSFTLAAWAVHRLLLYPGRLVTVLSNSQENGCELKWKCQELCQALKHFNDETDALERFSFKANQFEIRLGIRGQTGRIKVLSANPRTARGFSGDLILDEFAFHQDGQAIWEAAEPILSSNPSYLCRIASTPNGKGNMLYRMVSSGSYPVRKIPRSEAWRQGLPVYHPTTRILITPDEAYALAIDKKAYEQNYECIFDEESRALLSLDMILQAEKEGVGYVCDQEWSQAALNWMRKAEGPLYIGVDVGRERDLTVITVLETIEREYYVRGILRMRQIRLPLQEESLGIVFRMPQFRRAAIDMTGLGLGLYEYARASFPGAQIQGVNFGCHVPVSENLKGVGGSNSKVAVGEAIALELLRLYEQHQIFHPGDPLLREELRKPERTLTPGGRVSIAATRKGVGHADHFWSLALAVEASQKGEPGGMMPRPFTGNRQRQAIQRKRCIC